MTADDTRAEIARRQAALVAALVRGVEPPPGFAVERVRAAAAVLVRKRARAAARALPALERALGQRFAERFTAYAATMPRPIVGGSLADGHAFAGWLDNRGELPEAARLEHLAVALRYTARREGLVRRRLPSCRMAWLRTARRWVVAVRWPGLGERWLRISLGL